MEINDYSKSLYDYDELAMYFGEDYKVTDKIYIHQPTIGEIIKWGERKYYNMIHMLTCIPSDMKSPLDDIGINYMEISDFQLFIILSHSLTPNETGIILGDIDLSKFKEAKNLKTNETCLYYQDKENPENDIVIDEFVYFKIADYLRKIHSIVPKKQIALNETTRQILIRLDREKRKKAEKTPYKSQLKDLISAMMRYPAFKYKKNELKECGLYEFMDAVQGAQIYVSTTSLLSGMYSGMIDTSKISKKEFDWMRNIND